MYSNNIHNVPCCNPVLHATVAWTLHFPTPCNVPDRLGAQPPSGHGDDLRVCPRRNWHWHWHLGVQAAQRGHHLAPSRPLGSWSVAAAGLKEHFTSEARRKPVEQGPQGKLQRNMVPAVNSPEHRAEETTSLQDPPINCSPPLACPPQAFGHGPRQVRDRCQEQRLGPDAGFTPK